MKKGLIGFALMLLCSASAFASGWYGEEAYLRCNDDVRQAVWRGEFRSGYEHFLKFGQYENRITDGNCYSHGGGSEAIPPRPAWFSESNYLRCNQDVAAAVRRGEFRSGWHHYYIYGQYENRVVNGQCRAPGGDPSTTVPPRWWNDREYLRCNQDVARAVRRGEFRSGWHHYQLYGQYENRQLTCR